MVDHVQVEYRLIQVEYRLIQVEYGLTFATVAVP